MSATQSNSPDLAYSSTQNTGRPPAIRRSTRLSRTTQSFSTSLPAIPAFHPYITSRPLRAMAYSPACKETHPTSNAIQPNTTSNSSTSTIPYDHLHRQIQPKRISRAYLLIATIILIVIAGLGIPGGLTPRRNRHSILEKRVEEQLDVISKSDPNEILPDGPLPIDKIHREAIVHRGVWIFALDSHLHMLLCWRASHMKTCPATWSPIGEHAITNETFEDAANRGLNEEARFIARPRVYPIGNPFFYSYVYNEGVPAQRVDNQWTQAYIVLPRGDALDFRSIDDEEAQALQMDVENTRYQGMSLSEVIRHAVQRPDFFCNEEQVGWIIKIFPLVIRMIKAKDKRLYKAHLKDDWLKLIKSQSPVCCDLSEHEKEAYEVDITKCGKKCTMNTTLVSDLEELEEDAR